MRTMTMMLMMHPCALLAHWPLGCTQKVEPKTGHGTTLFTTMGGLTMEGSSHSSSSSRRREAASSPTSPGRPIAVHCGPHRHMPGAGGALTDPTRADGNPVSPGARWGHSRDPLAWLDQEMGVGVGDRVLPAKLPDPIQDPAWMQAAGRRASQGRDRPHHGGQGMKVRASSVKAGG